MAAHEISAFPSKQIYGLRKPTTDKIGTPAADDKHSTEPDTGLSAEKLTGCIPSGVDTVDIDPLLSS